MPVSTPNGYLDFTNATPRATKVIATSNVGVGFNNPLHALDVAGTANVGALTATTLSVTNTPLATLAANLVTYDSSTGVFQDSGGLFSNKLAVVSEQPPSALSGASTTVEKHGVYKVTASTGTPQNAFDKATGTSWVGSSSYTGGSGTGVYVGSTTLATGLDFDPRDRTTQTVLRIVLRRRREDRDGDECRDRWGNRRGANDGARSGTRGFEKVPGGGSLFQCSEWVCRLRLFRRHE